jgi:hypothetical protein
LPKVTDCSIRFNGGAADFWPVMVCERALQELQEWLEAQHSFLAAVEAPLLVELTAVISRITSQAVLRPSGTTSS